MIVIRTFNLFKYAQYVEETRPRRDVSHHCTSEQTKAGLRLRAHASYAFNRLGPLTFVQRIGALSRVISAESSECYLD